MIFYVFAFIVLILTINQPELDDEWDALGNWRYDMCKKYKWFDWVDNNIIFYIWDTPHKYYREIRHWLICNWNKFYWAFFKSTIQTYPWDFCFMYEQELNFLKYQLNYFEHARLITDEGYDARKRWIRYCIYLLEIITEHICIEEWDKHTNVFTCTKYVNMRNKSRFKQECWNEDYSGLMMSDKCYDNWPAELYKQKALYLYHKIRYNKSMQWWD